MENKDYKLIPFDIQRAKTPENPSGLEVVTESGKDVRIICTDKIPLGYPIVALIGEESILEATHCCDEQGVTFDESECLCLKEPIKKRLMTHKELSWWLRDAPEEHREARIRCDDLNRFLITGFFRYSASVENLEVPDSVYVRSNGGEWHEPLIEE